MKPDLHLTGHGPTLDELIALSRQLTGRDPTPEELAEAQKILAKDKDQ